LNHAIHGVATTTANTNHANAGYIFKLRRSLHVNTLLRVCPFSTIDFGERANLADAFPYQELFVNASLVQIKHEGNGVNSDLFPGSPHPLNG
jgi:hypothetical protein